MIPFAEILSLAVEPADSPSCPFAVVPAPDGGSVAIHHCNAA